MASATVIMMEVEGNEQTLREAQLTFAHLVAQQNPPRPAGPGARRVAREDRKRVIDAAATGHTQARAREVARIKAALDAYITSLGVGMHFQASDFIKHLWDGGSPPDDTVIDPRCTGAMFTALTRRGVLRQVGYRCNSGNPHTNYGSTARPVYVIDKLPEEVE